MMRINTSDYQKQGMFLHFANGEFLDFSDENIKRLGEEYWSDPAKIPPQVREHDDFKTCKVCPFRGQDIFCSAMKPLLPFLEKMENFPSYARVTAVYVDEHGVLSVAETDAQKALQYVTHMALFQYCEDAKQFHRYFRGIAPFMRMEEAMARVAINIYWIHQGDRAKIKEVTDEMRYRVTETCKSCIKRLNVLCKSDAFKNAYANTQIFTEFLAMNIDRLLERYFHENPAKQNLS